MRIYTDGVFDLLHRGHIENLRQCKNLFDDVYLIVGVINDEDSTGYKRKPIYCEEDRYILIENLRMVDQIVKNAPLIMTEEFLAMHNIDYVVHAFSNSNDQNKQDDFFKVPKKLNKFIEIPYYSPISTTQIIEQMK
jgi:cytidyltransferase-like protein